MPNQLETQKEEINARTEEIDAREKEIDKQLKECKKKMDSLKEERDNLRKKYKQLQTQEDGVGYFMASEDVPGIKGFERFVFVITGGRISQRYDKDYEKVTGKCELETEDLELGDILSWDEEISINPEEFRKIGIEIDYSRIWLAMQRSTPTMLYLQENPPSNMETGTTRLGLVLPAKYTFTSSF
jgi:DNA repair exonuclease SbcCD ATPase subunit